MIYYKNRKEYLNDIICPYCETTAIIDIDKDNIYNLNLLNCDNFHMFKNLSYDEFNKKKTKENESLKCFICGELFIYMTPPNNKMFICSCGTICCSCCKDIHKEYIKYDHYLVELKEKNYYCLQHKKKYESYCIDCNKNICEICSQLHNQHEIIKYMNIKPKKSYINKLKRKIQIQKNIFNNFVEEMKLVINQKISIVESYMNNYIKIEESLIQRYNYSFYNYQLLRNLNNINLFNNKVFDILNKFNIEKK